jgi:hypothetical protein
VNTVVVTTSAGVDVSADVTPAMPLAPTCATALSPTYGIRRCFASSYVPSSAAFTRKVRAMFGCSPAQKDRTPPSRYTPRTTEPIVVARAAVCICVFNTSVGLNTVMLSAPAVPPASSRCMKFGAPSEPVAAATASRTGS